MNLERRQLSRRFTQDRDFVRDALAGNQGESSLIPIFFALLIFVTGFAFGGEDEAGISVHLLDAASGLVAILTFCAAVGLRRILLRQSVGSNITIWALSGNLAALTPLIAISVLGKEVPAAVSDSVPVGLVAFPAIMFLLAIGVTSMRSASVRLNNLSEQLLVIRQRQENLSDEVRLIRGAIKSEIREELEAALVSSNAALTTGGEQSRLEVANQLREVIDQVVRPLSWTLNSKATELTESSTPQGLLVPERKPRSLQFPVEFARLMAPTLFTTMAMLFICPAGYFIDGIPGLISAVITMVLVLSMLLLARRGGISWHVKPWYGVALLTLVTAAVACVSPLVLYLAGEPLTAAPGLVLGFTLVQLAASSMMGLATSRLEQIHAATRANEQLELLANQRKQQIWVAKSELAKTVHGQVQSKLLVAVLQLENVTVANASRDALANIYDAVQSIEHGDEPASLSITASLEGLVEAWEGACAVTLNVGEAAQRDLDLDPIARACVVDVLIEAVANAAKHSSSPEVRISVQIMNDTTVELVCLSAGELPMMRTSQGFGTHVISEATSQWFLSQHGPFVELRAQVALNTADSSPRTT